MAKQIQDAYIVAAVRTPVGKAPRGMFRNVRPDDMLAHALRSVLAYCTHPVLSGKAVERIIGSALDELVVTDTIPLNEDAKACKKIRVLTVSGLLAETMRRISNEDSVSSLFVE